ncbi:unnamed protein product [Lactuca virosa]|uniref:Uncharacterized protein n=1 Tax=Lactuca virosa TaxID=75947 RepID=A0AAU9NS18_9ASTR|nr:unnamed protein product [Lactuca virosa]
MYLKVCFHFGGIGIGITYSDVKWIAFLGKDVKWNGDILRNIFVRNGGGGSSRWNYFSRWFLFVFAWISKVNNE